MTINDFKAEDTALVLVDFQTGTMGWVRSTDIESLQVRSVALAKAAKALGMPVVLTTSQEENVQGPLMAELIELFPAEYAARVRRTGVVNAMDDPDFAAAVKNTGRTNILIAGITNDVCTIFPTLTMLEQGYRVAVVADAGGSITEVGDEIAIRRMERAGADITAVNQILAQLAQNWAFPSGAAVLPSIFDLLPT